MTEAEDDPFSNLVKYPLGQGKDQ